MMSVLASLYLGTALLLSGTGSSSSLTEAKGNDYSVVEWVSKDSANWVSKVLKAIRYAAEACLQDMTYVFIRETCRDMGSEKCVRVVDKVWNVYSYYGGAPAGLDYVCQEIAKVVYPIIRFGGTYMHLHTT